jgi:hypothetical protein
MLNLWCYICRVNINLWDTIPNRNYSLLFDISWNHLFQSNILVKYPFKIQQDNLTILFLSIFFQLNQHDTWEPLKSISLAKVENIIPIEAQGSLTVVYFCYLLVLFILNHCNWSILMHNAHPPVVTNSILLLKCSSITPYSETNHIRI